MTSTRTAKIPITGDLDANLLLEDDPLALLLGMLLDQQVPMEWAFKGPATLKERLGGRLDAHEIAALDPDEVVAVFSAKPALHRYPGSMAKRTHAVCQHLVEHYDGDAAQIWGRATTGAEALANLRALPGYGEEKSKIFLAILGKRLGVAPPGWEDASAPFSDAEPRSVADVADEQSLLSVRAWKQAKKAAGKTKVD
jgi:uncharacterized HhH-GPD family protein